MFYFECYGMNEGLPRFEFGMSEGLRLAVEYEVNFRLMLDYDCLRDCKFVPRR
jgi:hypothetical protein